MKYSTTKSDLDYYFEKWNAAKDKLSTGLREWPLDAKNELKKISNNVDLVVLSLVNSVDQSILKKDELQDPLISKEHIFSFGWASEKEIIEIDKFYPPPDKSDQHQH